MMEFQGDPERLVRDPYMGISHMVPAMINK